MRSNTALVWACTAMAGVIAVASSLAVAADTLQDETAQFTVAPGTSISRSAQCHEGREVVSGGFYTEVGEAASLLPIESDWDSAPRWELRAANLGTGPGRAISYGYCTKPPIADTVRQGEDAVPAAGTASALGRCRHDRGESAVAGGFTSEIDNPAYPLASKMVGKRAWRATFSNPSSTAIIVYAEALCDVRDPKRPILTRSANTTVAADTSGKALAECEPREKMISGGFEAVPSSAPGASGYVHASRRRAKRGWQAMAHAIGGPLQLKAYAYCTQPD